MHNCETVHYLLPDYKITFMSTCTPLQVAEFMLRNSDCDKPVITGSSVHNQRIERLWRDVNRCIVSLYNNLFYYLEQRGKLDPLSDADLFCIHFVYLPKINEALQAFTARWNNHAITTEHCMTPVQLFTAGCILGGRTAAQVPPRPMQQSDSSSDEDNEGGAIIVPPTPIPITQHDIMQLQSLVDGFEESSNYSIIYDLVRAFVYDKM